MPEIPFDVYESPQELVIVLPLGGVKKETIDLKIEEYRVVVRWDRVPPKLKHGFVPLKEVCFWWSIEKKIDLPPQVYFDKIHSQLTAENVLYIVVPKVVMPEKIKVDID